MEVLELSDVFCYICRGILIEPVSLPCTHVFCLTCFQESMLETSYTCPLCRKRISNWARTAKKENKLTNVLLWNKIRTQYPKQVESKLNGLDDGLEQNFQEKYRPQSVSVSSPGEVAAEFKQYINFYNNERKLIEEKQIRESVELIKKIQEEEDEIVKAQYLKTKLLIEQDELMAKKLQLETDKEAKGSGASSSQTQRNRKNNLKGPLDIFISQNKIINGMKSINSTNKQRSSSCNSNTSSDSIQPEMHHFKPISVVPKTPPKLKENGRLEEISIRKVTPVRSSSCVNITQESTSGSGILTSKKIHSPYSAFRHQKSLPLNEECKKKLDFTDDESNPDMDYVDENVDTNIIKRQNNEKVKSKQKKKKYSSHKTDEHTTDCDLILKENLVEEQKRIEKMILQEKEDRELALKLNEEWAKIDKTVDRSKGSKRAYELRKNKVCKTKDNKRQSTLYETINNKRKKV